jgi:hypothetical protein
MNPLPTLPQSGPSDAADFGGERHQVDDLARHERTQRRLEPDPLANRVEHSLTGHGGDTAAHLGVDDDSDHADHDDPQQLVAEGCASRDVEDQVTDVDEAADRSEDPQRETEHLAHGQFPVCLSARSTAYPTLRLDGWSCSRRSVLASFAASFAFSRTFRSICGTVFRRESASAKLEDWIRSSSACSRAK